ncbi:hypothetical protein [Leptospira santarosai]|nr:hypothetical protein [Leptospira santarosai]MDI7225233.1 hypothetical protein [Leptospira santarosai]MDI7228434.1 hypothetical protein [Leptospira santarosai]
MAVSLIHQLFEVWEFLQIMSLCALFMVCSDSDFVGVPTFGDRLWLSYAELTLLYQKGQVGGTQRNAS